MSQSYSRPKFAQTQRRPEAQVAHTSSILQTYCACRPNPAWIDLCANRQRRSRMVRSSVFKYTLASWRSCRFALRAASNFGRRDRDPNLGYPTNPNYVEHRIPEIQFGRSSTVKNLRHPASRGTQYLLPSASLEVAERPAGSQFHDPYTGVIVTVLLARLRCSQSSPPRRS